MPLYTIKKIYLYTEWVSVDADSETEAKDKATLVSGDRNYDDHLYDCEVIDERESEPQ